MIAKSKNESSESEEQAVTTAVVSKSEPSSLAGFLERKALADEIRNLGRLLHVRSPQPKTSAASALALLDAMADYLAFLPSVPLYDVETETFDHAAIQRAEEAFAGGTSLESKIRLLARYLRLGAGAPLKGRPFAKAKTKTILVAGKPIPEERVTSLPQRRAWLLQVDPKLGAVPEADMDQILRKYHRKVAPLKFILSTDFDVETRAVRQAVRSLLLHGIDDGARRRKIRSRVAEVLRLKKKKQK